MSLFDILCDFIEDPIRTTGRVVGKVFETAGDILGSPRMMEAGMAIQDLCTKRVSTEASYEKTQADIYTTDRLNEILTSYSTGYYEHATSIENKCIESVEQYYDRLIAIIESVPGDDYGKASLKALKTGRARIAKKISGQIKEPLAKRMSLDDAECLAILRMDAGAEKGDAMANFCKKVMREAVNNLADRVKETLHEQVDDVLEYLNSICEEQEREMKTLKEYFDKMLTDNASEQSQRERNCVMPLVTLDAVEEVCEILG